MGTAKRREELLQPLLTPTSRIFIPRGATPKPHRNRKGEGPAPSSAWALPYGALHRLTNKCNVDGSFVDYRAAAQRLCSPGPSPSAVPVPGLGEARVRYDGVQCLRGVMQISRCIPPDTEPGTAFSQAAFVTP